MPRWGWVVCGIGFLGLTGCETFSSKRSKLPQNPYAAYEAPPLPPSPVQDIPVPTPVPEPSVEKAAPTPATASVPPSYSVWIWQENGDCLWRIAEKIYGDRSKWRLIYLANRAVIQDPNKIYPKQALKIPPADWQP